MSEYRIDRRLVDRKTAAAHGVKTSTTFAYESLWAVEERTEEGWELRWLLPTEAEARAWAEHGGEPPAEESPAEGTAAEQ
ncbi:MAG: hypothetical protein D6702_01940 [Planctomycetota bacterium]|nr:MAG: hypothetical protein D6702_01940 [Planctomycetota bacterium]